MITNILGANLLPSRHDTEGIELLAFVVVEHPSFSRVVFRVDGSRCGGEQWREVVGEFSCYTCILYFLDHLNQDSIEFGIWRQFGGWFVDRGE